MLHIVPEAVEAPAQCAVSRSTTGPFLDTQVTIPRHGRLYLSLPWLNSVADELGWVPRADLLRTVQDLDDTFQEREILRDRVERFDEDVQNVADALVSFLAVVRQRGPLLDELRIARETIATLDERIAALEGN